nr:MAG TPA: hypothetical protein [Caudoviricetes sp.]
MFSYGSFLLFFFSYLPIMYLQAPPCRVNERR